MCPHCRAFIDPKASVCEYCGHDVGKPFVRRPESALSSRGFLATAQSTTAILLLLNFAIFSATLILTYKVEGQMIGFGGVNSDVLLAFGAKFGPRILRGGEWWRLVTAGFLHAGVFHILMNSWVLLDLGPRVEDIFGTPRFLVIYLVSSIFGFLASMLWSPYTLSIGASAAACGLIGAMMAHARQSGNSGLWSAYLQWIILIAVIGFLPGFSIDNAAHFGGFGAGYGLAYLARTPRIASPVESLWKAAAGFAVVITAASFLLAYQFLSRALGS
jgi:rhomboid protease GluP